MATLTVQRELPMIRDKDPLTFVRLVAVISTNTFLVFKVILLWSPTKSTDNYYETRKYPQKFCVIGGNGAAP